MTTRDFIAHDDAVAPWPWLKLAKRRCAACGNRRPLYRYRGGPVRADRRHDLCMQCWRSVLDRLRALTRPNPDTNRRL